MDESEKVTENENISKNESEQSEPKIILFSEMKKKRKTLIL